MGKTLACCAALVAAALMVQTEPTAARSRHPYVDCGVNPANADCVYRTPYDPWLNIGVPPRSVYGLPPLVGYPAPYAYAAPGYPPYAVPPGYSPYAVPPAPPPGAPSPQIR